MTPASISACSLFWSARTRGVAVEVWAPGEELFAVATIELCPQLLVAVQTVVFLVPVA